MNPTTPITAEEMARAINEGAEVKFGFPVVVKRSDGSIAALDLVAASNGVRDPYMIIRTLAKEIIELTDPLDRSIYVHGMHVKGKDIGAFDLAFGAAPDSSEAHDPEANNRRLIAGRHAMRIQNAMIRARVLDAIDGWEAVRDTGVVIDDDPVNGTLISPNRNLMIRANVLVVRCPSTARRYALLIPTDMKTAREARLWTMERDDLPDVET